VKGEVFVVVAAVLKSALLEGKTIEPMATLTPWRHLLSIPLKKMIPKKPSKLSFEQSIESFYSK
jgi:hypothetical protein